MSISAGVGSEKARIRYERSTCMTLVNALAGTVVGFCFG
jgi:hypothetical protein